MKYSPLRSQEFLKGTAQTTILKAVKEDGKCTVMRITRTGDKGASSDF